MNYQDINQNSIEKCPQKWKYRLKKKEPQNKGIFMEDIQNKIIHEKSLTIYKPKKSYCVINMQQNFDVACQTDNNITNLNDGRIVNPKKYQFLNKISRIKPGKRNVGVGTPYIFIQDLIKKNYLDPIDFSQSEIQSWVKNIYSQKMNYDLESFIQSIKHSQNQKIRYKDLLIARFDYIVQKLFKDAKLKTHLYGSYCTGLALPHSDFDLVVTGFENLNDFSIQKNLQDLLDNLVCFKWVTKYQPLFNSNMPLLKLEIDLFIRFEDFVYPDPPLNFKIDANIRHLNYTQICQSFKMNIDLSLENRFPLMENFFLNSQCHIGLQSTKMISGLLERYPQVSKVILILKQFLYIKKYNISYLGGVNSYCLILMIIFSLQQKFMNAQTNAFELLFEVLEYYAEEFDPNLQKIVIDIGFIIPHQYQKIVNNPDESQDIQTESNYQANRINILEPLTQSSNLGKNSYLINQILYEFKIIKQQLLNQKQQFYEEFLNYSNLQENVYFNMEYIDLLNFQIEFNMLNDLSFNKILQLL